VGCLTMATRGGAVVGGMVTLADLVWSAAMGWRTADSDGDPP
jgi:hypothetical protein